MTARRLVLILAAIVLLASMVEYTLIVTPSVSVAHDGTIINEN